MKIMNNDEIILHLLHYFITNFDYEPLIVHGTNDELWLQNINNDLQIIRIVKRYVHNQEQYGFDQFKTSIVMRKMQFKTFTPRVKSLSIYLDMGDNIELKNNKRSTSVYLSSIDALYKDKTLNTMFPTLIEQKHYKKSDMDAFIKLTQNINETTALKNQQLDNLFKTKKPISTTILIAINIILFMMVLSLEKDLMQRVVKTIALIPAEKFGLMDSYRLLTASFMHIGILNFIITILTIYYLGRVVENYYGRIRMLTITILTIIPSALLTSLFLTKGYAVNATSVIYGLLGAYLYFAYYYRAYLVGVTKNLNDSLVLALILINLLPGVNVISHVGAFVAGLLSGYMLGVTKVDKNNFINATIMYLIYIGFLIFLII